MRNEDLRMRSSTSVTGKFRWQRTEATVKPAAVKKPHINKKAQQDKPNLSDLHPPITGPACSWVSMTSTARSIWFEFSTCPSSTSVCALSELTEQLLLRVNRVINTFFNLWCGDGAYSDALARNEVLPPRHRPAKAAALRVQGTNSEKIRLS